jgi:hypothetical protein
VNSLAILTAAPLPPPLALRRMALSKSSEGWVYQHLGKLADRMTEHTTEQVIKLIGMLGSYSHYFGEAMTE